MPGCATKGLGCGSRVDPTHPHAPICLSGVSLSPLIPRGWLSHSWSGSGSLSLVSGPFLLTDSADLGPGCFLPGADPRVSLVRAPGSLGLPAAEPAERAPQDVAARGHPGGHRDEDSRRRPGKGRQVRPQAPEVRLGGVQTQLARLLAAQTRGHQSHLGPQGLRLPGPSLTFWNLKSSLTCPVTV